MIEAFIPHFVDLIKNFSNKSLREYLLNQKKKKKKNNKNKNKKDYWEKYLLLTVPDIDVISMV